MVNVLTDKFDFTLPEVGGADDQWGDLLNGNWSKMETLLAGTFTSGGPATLGNPLKIGVPVTLSGFDAAGNALKIDNGYPGIWFHDTTPAGAPASPDLSMTAGNGWFRFGPADTTGLITATTFGINPAAPEILSYAPLKVYAEFAEVESGSPQVRFHETDAVSPAGQYMFMGNGAGNFHLYKHTGANWTSAVSIWNYNNSTDIFTIAPPTVKVALSGAGVLEVGYASSAQINMKRTSANYITVPDAASLRVMAIPSNVIWATVSSTAGWAAGSSDARLKENIADIEYGLDTVMALRPVQFDWIAEKKHDIGFIAQEVEHLIPEIVEIWEADPNIEGQIDTYAMRKDALTVVLVKAVQELTARVEALEGGRHA